MARSKIVRARSEPTLHEFMSRERMSVLQREHSQKRCWPWGEEYTATTLSSSVARSERSEPVSGVGIVAWA